MKKRYYYEISKEGDYWIAKRYGIPVFREVVSNLEQHGVALIAQTNLGTFKLYLPDFRAYGPKGPEYYYNMLTLILTDIREYQYFDTTEKGEDDSGIFLLKMDDYFTFIKTDFYSWYISEKEIAEGRKETLPKLYCREIEFREEFNYIGLEQFIVRTDSSDYLLRFYCSNVYGTGRQTEIINLYGYATTMPDFTRRFIVTAKIGQFIPLTYDEQKHPEIFGSIVPFSEEDKKHLLKSSKDCGYWFYDSDGNILRMIIFDSSRSLGSNSYQLDFEPAKSISFIKRYTFDKSEKIFLDIWKIDYADGNQKLLMYCKGKFILADLGDF